MTQKMLIDALYADELRVAVVADGRLQELDLETSTKKQRKGDVYLAKVIRIEPSLRAAFLDFGGDRHGFLAFSEIHPAYYQFPPEKATTPPDTSLGLAVENPVLQAENTESLEILAHEESDVDSGIETSEEDGIESDLKAAATPSTPAPLPDEGFEGSDLETSSYTETSSDEDAENFDEDELKENKALFAGSWKNYRIQDVIERNQVMLVQVVRDERSSKGAALTTYISLAGRYCVLMPNTPRGGGISRKITQTKDRQRLKNFLEDIPLPSGMGLIVRTAGSGRTKAEIKRDCDYLVRLWNTIREKTLLSVAPCLVHAEADVMTRAIRDLYTRDIDEVWVEGEEGYKKIKSLMRLLMPSHIKKIQVYKNKTCSLFNLHGLEEKIQSIHTPIVPLPSGGYLVINPAEALTAIDVNSGRSTRERCIEETALKTNEEAAEEIARQIRLRQLAGLIAIDFIDMEKAQSIARVEKRFRDSIRGDRARTQVLPISSLGILELSRQRLRPTLLEVTSSSCPHCQGSGSLPSLTTAALRVMRGLSEKLKKFEPSPQDLPQAKDLTVQTSPALASYLLNAKRHLLNEVEAKEKCRISIVISHDSLFPEFDIEFTHAAAKSFETVSLAKKEGSNNLLTEASGKSQGRKHRRGAGQTISPPSKPLSVAGTPEATEPSTKATTNPSSGSIIDSIVGSPPENSNSKNSPTSGAKGRTLQALKPKGSPPKNRPHVAASISSQKSPPAPAQENAPPAGVSGTPVEAKGSLEVPKLSASAKARKRRRRSRNRASGQMTSPAPHESPSILPNSLPPGEIQTSVSLEKSAEPPALEAPVSTEQPKKGWWKRLLDA